MRKIDKNLRKKWGKVEVLPTRDLWSGYGPGAKCHTGAKLQAEWAWVPVWHWAHKNLPYHTDPEPNNDFIIPLSH